MEDKIRAILFELLRTVEQDNYMDPEDLIDRTLIEVMQVIQGDERHDNSG